MTHPQSMFSFKRDKTTIKRFSKESSRRPQIIIILVKCLSDTMMIQKIVFRSTRVATNPRERGKNVREGPMKGQFYWHFFMKSTNHQTVKLNNL